MLGEFVFWLSLISVWVVFSLPFIGLMKVISCFIPQKASEKEVLKRDIRVYQKEIKGLRAKLMVVLLLLVFFAPIVGSPAIVGDAQVASEMIEGPQIIQENQFLESADGAISSDSIGESYSNKFRETLSDDVIHFPDAESGTGYLTSWAGVDSEDDALVLYEGGITNTRTDDSNWMWVYAYDITDYTTYLNLTVRFPTSITIVPDELTLKVDTTAGLNAPPSAGTSSNIASVEIFGYNYTSSSFTSWGTPAAAAPITFTHATGNDYLQNGLMLIQVKTVSNIFQWYINNKVRYCGVTYNITEANSFVESFSDVSDWTVDTGNTPTTDGDLIQLAPAADGVYDKIHTDSVSIANDLSYYYEYRTSTNDTSVTYILLYGYEIDGASTTAHLMDSYAATTTATTRKGIITHDGPLESIAILYKSSTASLITMDYLRITPATEMGFQHDGSTVEGVTALTGGSISSDGDELSMVADSDGSTFEIVVDTTATAAMLSTTYYPFLGLSFNSGDSADYIMVESYDGSAWATVITNTTIGTNTLRANIKAVDSYIEKFRLSVNPSATVRMDWMKGYSIANYTYSDSGTGIDDYLYVSSGTLYSSIDSGSIELNLDPALSVSDTYPVYNLSTGSTAPEFSMYVSSWSTYSDDTRGATTSGTITDIKLKFDGTEDLSVIEFIEDSTAPSVVRSSATPPDPDDNEVITLSAVVTDTVEVYTVKFNAISAPGAFSDVDYSATEIANNLWTYTFSSGDFPAGYYCFSIIANDGANENTLTTEQEFVDFTVREATIIIQEITLIGAGTDFTMMTFSARINRDCTYTIYEESTNNAETDTFAGSVSAPSFNLAWTKLSTTDPNVNFTIKFVSGSLTYNYTSQYQVAQTTFYVEDRAKTETPAKVTITGRITKFANYLVYDNTGNIKETGSITSLDIKISFNKWVLNTGQEIFFAIKFTNGSQTCWVNWTYYAIDIDEYGYVPSPGDAAPSWALTQTYWNILFMGVIIVAIIATRVQVGNLPNWRK